MIMLMMKQLSVMATKGTIESEKFNLLYKKYENHKTKLLPCIGLEVLSMGPKRLVLTLAIRN